MSQDSLGFPRVRYGLLGFARISQGLTRRNKVAQSLTRSHNVLAGGKGSRRRNQKLMINIVGFFSRYTYHSLLVVQESISIAYWSSQPSVPQHTTTPPRAAPPLALCVPSRAGRFWER